jgi:hypothetical protein
MRNLIIKSFFSKVVGSRKEVNTYFPLTAQVLRIGTPESSRLVSVAGDGGLEDGSEFGFDPSDPDLLLEVVVGASVS